MPELSRPDLAGPDLAELLAGATERTELAEVPGKSGANAGAAW